LLAHLALFRHRIDHPGFDWASLGAPQHMVVHYLLSMTAERIQIGARRSSANTAKTSSVGFLVRASPNSAKKDRLEKEHVVRGTCTGASRRTSTACRAAARGRPRARGSVTGTSC
jgi:hypothetical protein